MKFKQFRLGATGQFPRGRADETDEGALRCAIETDIANAMVRLRFGKPVAWIGLPVAECQQLAEALREAADYIERRKA